MGVIAAQLGHSDTRMTEKHYAHLAPSYVADTIRENFPNLGLTKDVAVTALPARISDCGSRGRWFMTNCSYVVGSNRSAAFTYTFASCGSLLRRIARH